MMKNTVVKHSPRVDSGLAAPELRTAARARIAQFRPVETIAYPGSAVPTRTKIPRDYVLRDLRLFVSGTITVGVANGTGLAPEQPFSIIRRIQVQGASGIRPVLAQIKDSDGAALFRLQHILQGTPAQNLAITSPNIAAYNFNFNFDIDFELTGVLPNPNNPYSGPGETLLRGDELNSLDLIIDWGDGTDLVIPDATTTLVLSNVQAVLGIHEFKDAETLSQRYKVHRFTTIEQVPAGATTGFNFDLRGRNILRGVLLKQFTQAPGVIRHTPVDTIIEAVKLRLNSEIREDWTPEDALRAENKISFSVETLPVGYLFLDLLHGGHRELAIQTGGFTSVDLLIDTASVTNGKIRAYPIEIIP